MSSRPWVIFDGDNTLWRTETLYHLACDRLADFLAARGVNTDESRAWQAAHDVDLAKNMGYSMHRFPQSLRDTARRFLGEGDHLWTALGFGYDVFLTAAEPDPAAADVLNILSERWNLALFTAGERSVQEKRVKDFPHTDLFKAVRIVPSKTEDVFRSLTYELDADPRDCWMVGDSLRSDILPAVAAGYNAVHYETTNWSGFETAGTRLPDGVHTVMSLRAAADLILLGT